MSANFHELGRKAIFYFLTGRCSVSPLSGIALSTNFTFRCENWIDADSPLVYEVSHGRDRSKTMLFYRSYPSGANISVTDWLVAGDERKNYSLTVEFNVKDTIGSKTVQHVDVQVGRKTLPRAGCKKLSIKQAIHRLLLTEKLPILHGLSISEHRTPACIHLEV